MKEKVVHIYSGHTVEETRVIVTQLRKQTRRVSLIEAVVNTAFGFTIQVGAQYLLFLLFDIPITASQFWLFTVAMTVLSVGRGYLIRRLFNSEFWKREVKHLGEITHTS